MKCVGQNDETLSPYQVRPDSQGRIRNGLRRKFNKDSTTIGQLSFLTQSEVVINCSFSLPSNRSSWENQNWEGFFFDVLDIDQSQPQYREMVTMCGGRRVNDVRFSLSARVDIEELSNNCTVGKSTQDGTFTPNPFEFADITTNQNQTRIQYLMDDATSLEVKYAAGTVRLNRSRNKCCSRAFFFSASRKAGTVRAELARPICEAFGGEYVI